MLIRGSGVRDIAYVLQIATKSVLCFIEKFAKTIQNKPFLIPKEKIYQVVQIDEMYTFVQNKGKKVWIFYAYSPETGEILAATMGKRTEKQVKNLLTHLKALNIEILSWATDHFAGFQNLFPKDKHLIGKEYTKHIEGKNCAVRAHLARFQRRSTKFSKKLFFQWYLFRFFAFRNNNRFA
jgi:insertion element IS1 protein InsB